MSKRIAINLHRVVDDSYAIHLGISLSKAIDVIQSDWRESRKFIITDVNVGKIYGRKVFSALRAKDERTSIISLPAGEKHKTRAMKERVEDQLIKSGIDRSSLIIALGGGVIGDLAGFVASTLLRGVSYVQIPTTLLAQVDSSIGGKVAVDHPLGKNLVGAFYQPDRVFIDVAVLKTLPELEFRNGMAEVIKYAAALDRKLFRYLEVNRDAIRRRDESCMTRIIQRCCELKKGIVQADEKELGLRRVLNFGHTIGHAVESLSDYRIPHGQAVAIGMSVEAALSSEIGLLNFSEVLRLRHLLTSYQLPTSMPRRINRLKLIEATGFDKKSQNGHARYTLLHGIGEAAINVPLSRQDLTMLLTR